MGRNQMDRRPPPKIRFPTRLAPVVNAQEQRQQETPPPNDPQPDVLPLPIVLPQQPPPSPPQNNGNAWNVAGTCIHSLKSLIMPICNPLFFPRYR